MPCDIYVVEDNQDDLFLLRESLVATGFEHRLHHHAGGPSAAQEILSALRGPSPPHVLILDYHVPAWTAAELMTALKANGDLSGIEVIVLSGTISRESAEALRGAGALIVLEKPFDLDGYVMVAEKIRDCCQRLDHQRPLFG